MAVAIIVSAVGCSSITIKPISDVDIKKEEITGIRFNRPAFFLVIGGDGNGNCQASILELPDTSQTYVAEARAPIFTSTSFQLTFADGWNLTGVNGSSDSTPLLSALTGGSSGGKSNTSNKSLL